jgi:hypothetical protein
VVAQGVRGIGGRIVEEESHHGLWEVPDRPEGPTENPRERRVEEGGEQRAEGESERVRAVSEVVAIVSAGVLAGGGAGMLGGAALGAINPFFLGIVGVVLGTGASVPLARAVLKRSEGGTGPPASLGPTQQTPDPASREAQTAPEAPETGGGERRPWWRRVFGG